MARILVIEDDRDMLELLRETLGFEGHQVVVARDGLSARQLLASPTGAGLDLIVLDLTLPRDDGSALLAEIRRSGDVPVLTLSVQDASSPRAGVLHPGADDLLLKPFDQEDLLARVETLLRRQGPEGTRAPQP